MDWSGVDYCDVFIRRHPFTAEDPLVSKWCFISPICSDDETNSSTSWMAWGCQFFVKYSIFCFSFRWTITLTFNMTGKSVPRTHEIRVSFELMHLRVDGIHFYDLKCANSNFTNYLMMFWGCGVWVVLWDLQFCHVSVGQLKSRLTKRDWWLDRLTGTASARVQFKQDFGRHKVE